MGRSLHRIRLITQKSWQFFPCPATETIYLCRKTRGANK